MKRVLERVNEEFQNVYTVRHEKHNAQGWRSRDSYRVLLGLRTGFLVV